MTEQRLPSADRPTASEPREILLASLIAPFAPFILGMATSFALSDVLAPLERNVTHQATVELLSFVGAIGLEPKWMALHACLIAWLGVVPAMMLLRALGQLRLWIALLAGAVLPLSTVSAITLLFWGATSAATSEKFIVYGMLVAMTVPAAVAAAAAFWGVCARVRR